MTEIKFLIGLFLFTVIVVGCTSPASVTPEDHPHEEGQMMDDGHHDEMMDDEMMDDEHPHEDEPTTDDEYHDE